MIVCFLTGTPVIIQPYNFVFTHELEKPDSSKSEIFHKKSTKTLKYSTKYPKKKKKKQVEKISGK